MFDVTDDEHGDLATVVLRDAASGSRATVVPSRGALAISLFAHGREWLYLDEATLLDPQQNVRGGIPVLFPSPGRLDGDRYTYGGRSGSMKQHGFARASVFREIGRGTDGSAWVELELEVSEATRAAFPWPFRFKLHFALRGATLTITARIENTGEETLPFALGYHPYFAVPRAEKAACRIPTRATRAWDNVQKREVAFEGLDLAAGEVDLHLVDHDSSGATLETPEGTLDLAGHFRQWVVWTLPDRDFVCLEPWTARANALNAGAAPPPRPSAPEGLTELAPGAERAFALTLSARR